MIDDVKTMIKIPRKHFILLMEISRKIGKPVSSIVKDVIGEYVNKDSEK